MVSSCGYGEKYHGFRRCRPSSMHSMFFIRVTMSSWLRSDTKLPVMRGADGIPSELSWESCPGPVENIRLQKTAQAGHLTARVTFPQLSFFKPNNHPMGAGGGLVLYYIPHFPNKRKLEKFLIAV